MAHPLLWPKKHFFYPVGNTPATCFTQQLAPEDVADVLLLGCGDPRSIMFTVHVDLGGHNRPLDFTCCDAEPAVLARNIILFSMIVDAVAGNEMLDNIWNIFYHFYLDKVSLNLLLDQCRKLIDTSTTAETWSSSKYGETFKFCTDASLLAIRKLWINYLETETLSRNEKEALSLSFSVGMKDVLKTHKNVSTAFRSAGPLWLNLKSMGADHFNKFWKTGTTTTPAPHINPIFAYSLSGRNFNAHYGTDPLLSYHLAVPLAPTKQPPCSPVTNLKGLDDSIRIQFRTWCTSFRTRLSAKSPQIVIRYFVGEALAFCQALQQCRLVNVTKTSVYTKPWGGSKTHLRGEDYSPGAPKRAPLSFNTIDTSNLSDHLGLLNVLLVTKPLLRDAWSSTLHTHTLLPSGGHESLQKGLLDKTCANIPMLSLLLGVVPSRHLSEITSVSSCHEFLPESSTMSGQFHDSLSWKIPLKQEIPSDEPLCCEALQLGEFFFAVYLKMFADENAMATFQNPNIDKIKRMGNIHYSRLSFVAFLDLAKSRVETDWPKAMGHLMSRIERDKTLLVGMNNYQELCCILHLREVQSYVPSVTQASPSIFQGWKDVPKVVCIVLVVPRPSLKCLEDMHPDEIGTPILQCEIKKNGDFQNVFYSIRPIFGNVEIQHDSPEPKINIREDTEGWNGSSPLIISFYAPAWILTISPSSTQVVLSVRPTPSSTASLMRKLGLFLTVYSASAIDKQHVFVSRHRPDNLGEVQSFPAASHILKQKGNSSPALGSITVNLDTSHTQASLLTKRVNVNDPDDRNALSTGATVITKQISDFAILITFGKYQKVLEFPLPVDGSRLKTRIARKSFYVEVEAHIIADLLDRRNISLDPFPIVVDVSLPKLSNVHYLQLDRLPTLDFASGHKLDWLRIHLAMAFSDRERAANTESNQKDRGALVNMKESIRAILTEFSTKRKGRPLVAGLTNPSDGGIHTLIFVSEVKLDLTSHTVVADACVLPLTDSIMPLLDKGLQKITNHGLQQIITLEDEGRAWKQLLPALAERCRTWKHTVNCEYISKGIPASFETAQSPLCGCGKGKNLGPFSQTSTWKDFAPFVTRIALAPLFSASFLESTSAVPKTRDDGAVPEARCKQCGKAGNPTLLTCSACKVTKYCSASCQKADWKEHKVSCTVTE